MKESLKAQAIDNGQDEGGYIHARTGMHTAPKIDNNAKAQRIGPKAYMIPILRERGICERMTDPRNTCLMLT